MLNALSKRALGVVLVAVIVGASGLLYCWFFPPLELKITAAVSSPLVINGVTLNILRELAYSVSYTNHGVYDLTISGEIQTKIEGIREVDAQTLGEKMIIQPRFLLRIGETVSWTVLVGAYGIESASTSNLIHLKATAFLTVNGMERTFTANYQFTGP
jgi:hypothetical protein